MSEVSEIPQTSTNVQKLPLVRRIGQILGIKRSPALPPETTLLEQRRAMEAHDDPGNIPTPEDLTDQRLVQAASGEPEQRLT